MLLDSRSDAKHFKKALDSLSQKANEGTLTWCSKESVPDIHIEYADDNLRTAFIEETVNSELS